MALRSMNNTPPVSSSGGPAVSCGGTAFGASVGVLVSKIEVPLWLGPTLIPYGLRRFAHRLRGKEGLCAVGTGQSGLAGQGEWATTGRVARVAIESFKRRNAGAVVALGL